MHDHDDEHGPAREVTADELARERMYDRDFEDWLWQNGFLQDGPHQTTMTHRTFTAQAVALLWDLFQGHAETASALAARRQREADERARREAEAQRTRAEADAKAQERQAAELARQAEVRARFSDEAWRRGDTPEAVRAVAAWRRSAGPAVTLRLREGAARAALVAADEALQRDMDDRARQLAEFKASRYDVARALRGEAAPVAPRPFDLNELWDHDTVARWLVGHREDLAEFALGHWRRYDRPAVDGDDGGRDMGHEWIEYEPGLLPGPLTKALGRWSLAAEFHVGADQLLRAKAADVAAGAPDLPAEVADAASRALGPWLQRPPKPQAADLGARPDRTRAPGRRSVDAEELADRIRRAVSRFGREHHRKPRSKNEALKYATGKDVTLGRVFDAMMEDGRLAWHEGEVVIGDR